MARYSVSREAKAIARAAEAVGPRQRFGYQGVSEPHDSYQLEQSRRSMTSSCLRLSGCASRDGSPGLGMGLLRARRRHEADANAVAACRCEQPGRDRCSVAASAALQPLFSKVCWPSTDPVAPPWYAGRVAADVLKDPDGTLDHGRRSHVVLLTSHEHPEVEVNDLGPSHEDPDLHEVEFRPVGSEPAAVEWDLLPPRGATPRP